MNGFFGGVGLRSAHFQHLLKGSSAQVKWLEALSENYMGSFGHGTKVLLELRKAYPVALHGVGLNLASPDPLNPNYLTQWSELIEKVDPFIVSDHLCWTGLNEHNSHDLLPFVRTKAALKRIARKIDEVQNFLKRPLLIENISAYVDFDNHEYSEAQFLSELVSATGCGLLLDLNNVYVNSINLGWDWREFLRQIPMESVGQIHLAGFTDCGDHLFDTHSEPVAHEVWLLFAEAIRSLKRVPVLLEWDDKIPAFDVLEAELSKANEIWREVKQKAAQPKEREIYAGLS